MTSEHSEHEQQPDEAPARPVAPAQSATSGDQGQRKKLRSKALRDVLLYGFLRLLLFLVLTVIIHSIVILLGMASYFPLLISMTLALLLALPLSMFMFKKLRLRVTAEVAEWDAGRKAHRAQLRDQLRERLDE
ncbi:DUF4229 domain-containing protein [Corynebacterium falsenii]|uniref:DUF4229 domain-containing protein n=1 Tax=Corynebacterium falsenii TaxID=108486 RepID=UPI001CCB7CC2|nr:DUF4229 domain-containing protein [Corynebacterium falsenii]UBI07297.1 DUF4229 domain-containing protein [Corynebacterium falsenii]HJF12433.1 DUF4229 domain-containing protein [Corynebacterium falsenii]